jgi:hypothetical protein
MDTSPDLIDLILQYLNAWRYDKNIHPLTKPSLWKLLSLQDTIGARQFFEGWVHKEWEVIQTKYLNEISSRRSGKRWTSALISKMWDVAWDLWEHRNAVYHHTSNKALASDSAILDTQVRVLIQKLDQIELMPKDQHLAIIPFERLTTFPRIRKVEWIRQTSMALAQAKKRNYVPRQSQHEKHRRHQSMINSMQTILQNWLDNTN